MEPPTLPALRSPHDNLLAVFCPHCKELHVHGGGSGAPGSADGHLRAPCPDKNSPFSDSGYIVREMGLLTRDNMHRYFDRTRPRGIRKIIASWPR
jgi:hypothetical protein